MSELKWEDPPAVTHRPYVTKWARIVDALKERPGEWALVDTRVAAEHHNPSSMFGGQRRRLKAVNVEAVSRLVDGEIRLYARWPSENGEASK